MSETLDVLFILFLAVVLSVALLVYLRYKISPGPRAPFSITRKSHARSPN